MEFADFYNLYLKDQSDRIITGRITALIVLQHPERGAAWISRRYKQTNEATVINYRSMLLNNARSLKIPDHLDAVMPEFAEHAQDMNIVPPKMIDWVMKGVHKIERADRGRKKAEKQPEFQPSDYVIEKLEEQANTPVPNEAQLESNRLMFVAGTLFGVVLTMGFYLLNSAGV